MPQTDISQISLKIIAMRVAQKPEIASVDASAETLISADKKYIEVYEKQSGHWKPKIIIRQEINSPKRLINLSFSHHISL
jgi:hypothetical protein